jgi:DNA-dependent protein kinase catalytic subunit
VYLHKAQLRLELSELTTWFDAYAADGRHDIELPGMAATDPYAPQPAAHAVPRLAGAQRQVRVLTSLWRPVRLTALGTDEREHMLLVKRGEDVRIDQRVEQLFSLMNTVLGADAACAAAGLRLRTYAVVPVQVDLGVIQWVPHTDTLRNMVLAELRMRLNGDQKLAEDRMNEARTKYATGVATIAGTADQGAMYANCLQPKHAAHVQRNLENAEAMLPADLLREGVLAAAASPEARVLLRQRFVASLATVTIAGYIIGASYQPPYSVATRLNCVWLAGLGDRHLDNFLVDRRRCVPPLLAACLVLTG